MVKEFIFGQMDANMMVCGKMVNSTDKEFIYFKMVQKEKDIGNKEKELNGYNKI